MPDSAYYVKFPEVKDSIWHNHTQVPYLFLAERLPANGNVYPLSPAAAETLDGSWQLEYIAGQHQPIDSLFRGQKPVLSFNTATGQVSGNTGCNSLTGKFTHTVGNINFVQPFALTRMSCEGVGENTFLEALKSVNRYSVNKKNLTLIVDDVAVMSLRQTD